MPKKERKKERKRKKERHILIQARLMSVYKNSIQNKIKDNKREET